MSDLLENIKDFFTDIFASGPSKTGYWTLYKNLSYWKKNRIYPNSYDLTTLISLTDNFWNEVINIYRSTKSDGRERAISVFWLDGELIVSSLTKGSETSVTPDGKVSVKYEPTSRKEYYRKEIYVDEKLYSKQDIYYKKIPKQIELEHLFSMHSHPPHEEDLWQNNDHTKIQKESYGDIYVGKNSFFSFFSLQDIKSLFASTNPVTGLVTDRLWLIFRTNQSIDLTNQLTDADVNLKTLTEEMQLVVYQGEFRKTLVRVNSE
jgi:hypothetical protein